MFGGQDPQSRNDKQSDAKVHLTQSYAQGIRMNNTSKSFV